MNGITVAVTFLVTCETGDGNVKVVGAAVIVHPVQLEVFACLSIRAAMVLHRDKDYSQVAASAN